MALAGRMKRSVFLVHRWTGVLMCALMALWFASGMVMLFAGYPKLTPAERLANLPALRRDGCCIGPAAALAHARAPGAVQSLVLTSIRGRPFYVLVDGDGAVRAVDALDGAAAGPVGAVEALAGARVFVPGAAAHYAGTVMEDRWTHARAFDAHRPLHVVDMDDAAATRLYLSSATGQVLLDAPRAQRLWNFAGAWLHWLYMLRNQPSDPAWTWTVIVLSALGVVAAFTGILNGIWRWRFKGRYKNGRKSPFREAVLHWHHVLGLAFGLLLFGWILSGLMSMNPLGIFDARGRAPDAAAFAGGRPGQLRPDIGVAAALALLDADGFGAVELEWRVLGGQPYLLARDGGNGTRLVAPNAASTQAGQGTAFRVLRRWPDATLLQAARRLLPAAVEGHDVLHAYDAYYYKRQVQSMYGADDKRLPVLRVTYADEGRTWVHLDPFTGSVESGMDRSQRLGRWLFNFLHSWDLPAMLDAGWLREAVLVLLACGGLALSATATVLGARRLRMASKKAG
ncbi:PepSY domain-containing protein [Massilia forsythiae]|uniref:PepSY domain-containing protein n=2 Tax=Massilia forsythiae TaxID=2728020 RepID=A0A7Z2ZRA6_9BURK|nr:PepSY domain-containing protein [Massilia forsythiae]